MPDELVAGLELIGIEVALAPTAPDEQVAGFELIGIQVVLAPTGFIVVFITSAVGGMGMGIRFRYGGTWGAGSSAGGTVDGFAPAALGSSGSTQPIN